MTITTQIDRVPARTFPKENPSTRPVTEAVARNRVGKWLFYGMGSRYLGTLPDEYGTGLQRINRPTRGSLRAQYWQNPLVKHLQGVPHGFALNPDTTHIPAIIADLDRHDCSISKEQQAERVAFMLRQMKSFLGLKILADVNPANGSVKLHGFWRRGERFTIQQATGISLDLRDLVWSELGNVEIFTVNNDCMTLPFNPCKLTLIDTGELARTKALYRMIYAGGGKKRREHYESYSMLAFEDWLAHGESVFEDLLIATILQCGDPVRLSKIEVAKEQKKSHVNTPPVSPLTLERFCKPELTEHLISEPNSFERQRAALLIWSRKLGRVPDVDDALSIIYQNGLYSGDWSENQMERTLRVADIIEHIGRTFDPKLCKVKAGQTSAFNWEEELESCFAYGERVFDGETEKWSDPKPKRTLREKVSVEERIHLLAVLKFCQRHPNKDGTIPRGRPESLFAKFCQVSGSSVRWSKNKWVVFYLNCVQREWLESVTEDWTFGKAKVFVFGEMPVVEQEWKSIRPVEQPAVLDVFGILPSFNTPHPITTYADNPISGVLDGIGYEPLFTTPALPRILTKTCKF